MQYMNNRRVKTQPAVLERLPVRGPFDQSDDIMLYRCLVTRLRELAKQGATIRMMSSEISERIGFPLGEDSPIITILIHIQKSFCLPLRQVRSIEACDWRGNDLSGDEIDALLLPLIAGTRHLWESDPDPEASTEIIYGEIYVPKRYPGDLLALCSRIDTTDA